jgi:PmbA protein
MSKSTKDKSSRKGRKHDATTLLSVGELHAIIDNVLRLAKSVGVAETEVHVDEVADALTRFANNAIHQNVAEHGLTVSVRTVVDGRTARATTNRIDEDSLRTAIDSSLSLAHSQPEDPHLLVLPGKQRYRPVNRFVKQTAAYTPEERALAVRRACDLAAKRGQNAAGIFATGQSQTAIGNSRGLFATYRETHAEFSITMQEAAAASWAKANAANVGDFEPQKLAERASEKAHRAVDAKELAPGRYTVILEPAAVLDLAGFLFYDFFRDGTC